MSYRFLAADLDNNVFANLPVKTCRFTEVLNDAGTCEITMPLVVHSYSHPDQYTFRRDAIDPMRTTIYVEHDGQIVWGGLLFTAQARPESNELTLGAAGFLQYLQYRLLSWNYSVTNVEQQTIIYALLTDVYNISHTHVPDTPNPNPGNVTVPFPNPSGVLRTRSYFGYERKPILEIIRQMSEVINGFDFGILSSWDTTRLMVLNEFDMWWPFRGQDVGATFTLFPPTVTGSNIAQIEVPVDATIMANNVDALGSGTGASMLISTATDTESIYPRMEKTVDYKTVTLTGTLQDHADRELALASIPISSATVTLMPDRPETLVNVGDIVQVYVDHGWLQLGGQWRVLERSVEINPRMGTEQVRCVIAPWPGDVFVTPKRPEVFFSLLLDIARRLRDISR